MDQGIQMTDYRVYLGVGHCDMESLFTSHLFCLPPKHAPAQIDPASPGLELVVSKIPTLTGAAFFEPFHISH